MSLFQYIPGSLLFVKESQEISKSIQRSAKRVADLYNLHAKDMNKLLRDINAYNVSSEAEWQNYFNNEGVSHILPLTTISFLDANTKIKCQAIVVYNKQSKSQIKYDPDNQYLLIYDVNAKRLPEDKLETVIAKELVNKSKLNKTPSTKYRKIPNYKKTV